MLTDDDVPRRFNLASYFVDRNVEEGRGGRAALITPEGRITYADVGLWSDENEAALGRVLELLGDGERALAVGHSPTNEAAVLGLTGELVAPLGKGAGVLVTADEGGFRVEVLEP